MATEQTVTAIVLRRFNSGESDRRITLLTSEQGKIDVFAKGARKSASRLGGATEPLTVGTYHLAAGRALAFVTQFQPHRSFPGLRTDLDRLMPALAIAEFTAATLASGQESADAFQLLIEALAFIENHPKPLVAATWAFLRVLAWEGVQPVLLENVIDGGPLDENPAYVSPTAGGFIGYVHAANYRDSFPSSAEVLLGLGKTAALDQPPPNLRQNSDCLKTLLPFLEHHAHAPLPALRQLVHPMI